MKHSAFNLYQQISCTSLVKEIVESNFININSDLNWGKKVAKRDNCHHRYAEPTARSPNILRFIIGIWVKKEILNKKLKMYSASKVGLQKLI